MKLSQSHIFVLILSLLIFHLLIWNEAVPTKLASRMEQNITQARIEGICIFDALKISSIAMQNDILAILRPITIPWQKNSYLLNSGIWWKIAAPICMWIKAQNN